VAALAQEPQWQQARLLQVGLDALCHLHIGLILCDPAARVIGANRFAESILSAHDGMERSAEGVLCATHQVQPSVASRVQQVAGISRRAELAEGIAVFALTRGNARRPLSVFLRPSHKALKKSLSVKAAVLALILDTALPVGVMEPELQQLYGFTSSEARLANLLMEGKALGECCQELGIQRSTGCTHLRGLFKKTRVHRQSELVVLLLKSIGLARLGARA
jgi:DNA-binding CsgD family transcriptional regulator